MFRSDGTQSGGIRHLRFGGFAEAASIDGSMMVIDGSGAPGAGVNVVGCGGVVHRVRGACGAGGAPGAGVGRTI
jgi:hypothetical protein